MKQKIYFELAWILFTLILVGLIILPIYLALGDNYDFYIENILVIIIAITFIRYIFFLKHLWLSYSNKIKVVFIFIPIVVLVYLMDTMYDFQAFSDEEGLKSIMGNLSNKKQEQLSIYIRTEMVLFWVAAFISNALLPFRMLVSIWKKINKGYD